MDEDRVARTLIGVSAIAITLAILLVGSSFAEKEDLFLAVIACLLAVILARG